MDILCIKRYICAYQLNILKMLCLVKDHNCPV